MNIRTYTYHAYMSKTKPVTSVCTYDTYMCTTIHVAHTSAKQNVHTHMTVRTYTYDNMYSHIHV